jgi:hypothetical protein
MVTFIMAGRLLGASFACGLNLYATVALVGLASRFGWIEALPFGLRGLENGLIIACALVLFAAEAVSSAVPVIDSAWEAVHTVIRPIAAMALAALALEGAPLVLQMTGAGIAGGAALAAHSAKVGLRLVVMRRRFARIAISALEDLTAIGLTMAVLAIPAAAVTVVAAFAAILTLVGPRLWRAAAFGARAVIAGLRGFFGSRDWRRPGEVPSALRSLIVPAYAGAPEPRVVRATIRSARSTGAWRNGWLVFNGHGATFVYRGFGRARQVPIANGSSADVHIGFLSDMLQVDAAGSRGTLFLLKDGPPAETTAGALPS